jgi:hypothetical protein
VLVTVGSHTLVISFSSTYHLSLCLSHSFLSVKILQPKKQNSSKEITNCNNFEEPNFINFQEGKCEDSGKFAMEFASHAYSALELSDSYVRFLSSVSRRPMISSSALETTMLLLAGGPLLVVDQSLRRRICCQNQKESLRISILSTVVELQKSVSQALVT